jgi:hypothetical protein
MEALPSQPDFILIPSIVSAFSNIAGAIVPFVGDAIVQNGRL